MEKVEKAKDCYKGGKYRESIGYAEEGLSVCKKLTDILGEAQARHVLAWSHYMIGEYEQSRKHGDRLLNITEEVRDKKLEANARQFLACLFYRLEDYDQSIKNGHQSLSIAEYVQDKALEARAHHVLAKSCHMAADYKYRTATPNIATELGDSVLEGGACLDVQTQFCHATRVTRGFQNIEDDDQLLSNGVKGREPKPGSLEVLAQSYHTKEAVNRTPRARSQLLLSPYGDNDHSQRSQSISAGKDFLRLLKKQKKKKQLPSFPNRLS